MWLSLSLPILRDSDKVLKKEHLLLFFSELKKSFHHYFFITPSAPLTCYNSSITVPRTPRSNNAIIPKKLQTELQSLIAFLVMIANMFLDVESQRKIRLWLTLYSSCVCHQMYLMMNRFRTLNSS